MVKRKKMIKKGNGDRSPEKRRATKLKDGEVEIARDRFAGALKGVMNRDESDEFSNQSHCSTSSNTRQKSKDSSPQAKKKNNGNKAKEDQQSFVLRLFDRGIDLAPFDITTPLYPLCRTWIQNKKPVVNSNGLSSRSGHSQKKQHNLSNGNINPQFINGHTNDVYELPPPIPKPLNDTNVKPTRKTSSVPVRSRITKAFINSENTSRETLLKGHLQNWIGVKNKWKKASQLNEERYAASREILTNMFVT